MQKIKYPFKLRTRLNNMNNSEYHKKHGGFQFYLDIYDDENYPIVTRIPITENQADKLNENADDERYLRFWI